VSRANYIAEIEHRVAGIPCLIGVTHYESVRGSYSYHAPSDYDYYGYTESEWEILDRRGRPAPWLARKATSKDNTSIEEAISNALED
jgi:hypothetical protein